MTFWEGICLLVVRVVNGIDDVALMRAEFVTSCFHVPCVEKLLLATFAGIVVLHLNLHYPCMVHMFRNTVHSQVHTETFSAAEVCYTNHHRSVLVFVLLLVHHLHVGAGVDRAIYARPAICTVFHSFSFGPNLWG